MTQTTLDGVVFECPKEYIPGRIRVDKRDDSIIRHMFDGIRYIAAYEELGPDNLHYHLMIPGTIPANIRKRMSRYAEGKTGAYTWTKEKAKQPQYYTWDLGVAYSIKGGEWWGSDTAIEAYARLLPPYVKPADRDAGAPKDPTDRKKMDWMLTERNVRRLYHAYKHKVEPRPDGVYDFFDVIQYICRNTNWKMSRSFMYSVTRYLVWSCEDNDAGTDRGIKVLRDYHAVQRM